MAQGWGSPGEWAGGVLQGNGSGPEVWGSPIPRSAKEQERVTFTHEAWMMFSPRLFPDSQALTIGHLLTLKICHFHPGAWVTSNSW